MTKLFKLAWRDIWRNRRRSLLTMGAIVFAMIIITLANAVNYGTFDAMEELSARLFTGDLKVQRLGFGEERTLAYSLEEDEQDWAAHFDAYPWVEATTKRLSGYGLVSSDSSSAGAAILGIEPETEPSVSTFANTISDGQVLTSRDTDSVLLGETLAENLNVGVGDTVVVLTQGYHNVMGAELYAVKGLLHTGSPDVDRAMMIMPLPTAQALFAMEGRFTEIVVRTNNFRGADGYAATLGAALGEGYEVPSWRAMMPEIQQMRAFKESGNYIFFLFLILLIGFEIFNTTTMSMMERVREFGVMLSLGMKPGQVSLLIGLELVMKVFLALAVGFGITFLIVLALKGSPIPLPADLQDLYQDFGLNIDGFSISARPVVFVFPMVAVGIVALTSVVYPILRLRRFSPVEALRTA